MSIKTFFSRLLRGGIPPYMGETLLEVSQRLDELAGWMAESTERLSEVEKKTEATRRKVYRDEDGKGEEPLPELAGKITNSPGSTLASLSPGDYIPPELMNQFGG